VTPEEALPYERLGAELVQRAIREAGSSPVLRAAMARLADDGKEPEP
jgi:hypothetical protein